MTLRGPRSVAVIGGGITGLTVAWRMLERAPGTDVVIFEATGRLGGKIRTISVSGGIVEAGPDSFVARDALVQRLCAEAGLAEDLIEPDVFGAALWTGKGLRRLPPGSFWGLPPNVRTALASPLSPGGRVRALADLFALRSLSGDDVAVGSFVGRRFGPEVVENLVEPLLAGTRAGSSDAMSLAAALPQIDTIARRHRSVIRGIARERRQGRAAVRPPRFMGIKGGMERLVTALAGGLENRAELVTSVRVESISPARPGFELALASGDRQRFDAVMVCTPAPRAAALLRALTPDAAAMLGAIKYAPVCSVALIYPEDALELPEGTSGVLLPRHSGRTISACTWWTRKWTGVFPGRQVVRCFVGHAAERVIPNDDRALAGACARDVGALLGSKTRPDQHSVTRWSEGLPHYRVGHLERLAFIERALSSHAGLALAGAAYRGAGLADCIAQGETAVSRLLSTG